MSLPRPGETVTYLTMLQESLNRVVAMLLTLPKYDKKAWQSIVYQYMSQQYPDAEKPVFTTSLVFDELKRLKSQLDVCCSLGILATKKSKLMRTTQSPTSSTTSTATEDKETSREMATQVEDVSTSIMLPAVAADDLVAFSWPLFNPLSEETLKQLSAQLTALYDSVHDSRPGAENRIENIDKQAIQKSLNDVEYFLTSLGSVVAQALQERAAKIVAKEQKEVQKPSVQSAKAAASQQRAADEDLRNANMLMFLSTQSLPAATPVGDLSLTQAKYRELCQFIDAISGAKKPGKEDKAVPAVADSAGLTAKEINTFRKKDKVQELHQKLISVSHLRDNPLFRYHLMLAYCVNTLVDTSERAHEVSRLFSPSHLRARMTDFLQNHLGNKAIEAKLTPQEISDYRGNLHKMLYDMHTAAPNEISTLGKREWVIHTAIDLYASLVTLAMTPGLRTHVADLFDDLLSVKKQDYVSDIVSGMRRRTIHLPEQGLLESPPANLLKVLLQMTYPLSKDRNKVYEEVVRPMIISALEGERKQLHEGLEMIHGAVESSSTKRL